MFSVQDFRNWLSKQNDMVEFFDLNHDQCHDLLGKEVVAKVSQKKLLEKVKVEEGDVKVLIKDFVENGGTILELKGKSLLIEVSSGSFYVPRGLVRVS